MVWIVGDSIVTRAGEWAKQQGKPNLQLQDVAIRWMGKGGMVWQQLLPILQYALLHNERPTMIIIMLGGNDIPYIDTCTLTNTISTDIHYLQSVYTSTYIVWSNILPRLKWRSIDISGNKAMDLKRKRVNRAGCTAIHNNVLGRFIIHDIDRETEGFYAPDGTHLSPVGNQMLIYTFKNAILTFLTTKVRYASNK